jgi:uncharacterized membrane protein
MPATINMTAVWWMPRRCLIAMKTESRSILVRVSTSEAYGCLSRLEELAEFMDIVHEVKRIDDAHFVFSYTVRGVPCKGDVQVLLRIPERRIVWRLVSGHSCLGVISLESRSDHSTELTLKISSDLESANLPELIDQYLEGFKGHVEEQTSSG